MTLQDLVGPHDLTGVDRGVLKAEPNSYSYEDANTLLFVLDGKTYRVTEDPSDGYRSSMRDVEEVRDEAVANLFPPVKVIGRYLNRAPEGTYSYGEWDILELLDVVTGKTVLRVGTTECDDYYPSFVGEFTPEHMACNQAEGQP